MRTHATTRPVPAWSVAALAALIAAMVAALLPAQPATTRVVVTTSQALSDAVRAVTAAGGDVVGQFAPFGTLVAEVPETQVGALTADPRTAAVSPDVAMRVQGAGYGGGQIQPAVATVGADAAWRKGATGKGVGVVLVDTGINDHADLAGRIAAKIDFTDDHDGIDHYGHGTFLAGLVAGDGASSGGRYTGVAPDAHLVSVKVADASGTTSLSQVLQGLIAADRARELYDAPVVVLALAGPDGTEPDPLMIAVEMLWARGSTVVVAAGNGGPGTSTVGSPGADPYVLTVGADDDHGTPRLADDTVPEWSAQGLTAAGFAKPDVVAPGVSTVGLRAPGSTIDAGHPDAVVGTDYFKGTGTSMSSAIAGGAAAVLLSAEPGLTPDQVKGRLTGSAADLHKKAHATTEQVGAGVLNVAAALSSDAPAANADLPPLPQPSTEPMAVPPGMARHGKTPKVLPAGWSWSGWSWSGWSWSGWSWSDQDWAGWSWSDDYWAGWSWSGWSWSDQHWAGWSWSGWSWSGKWWLGWSWSGADWNGWSWSGWSWSDQDWAGWSWSGWSWSGWSWSGWSWSDRAWA